jgi:hypothetical protein
MLTDENADDAVNRSEATNGDDRARTIDHEKCRLRSNDRDSWHPQESGILSDRTQSRVSLCRFAHADENKVVPENTGLRAFSDKSVAQNGLAAKLSVASKRADRVHTGVGTGVDEIVGSGEGVTIGVDAKIITGLRVAMNVGRVG